MTAARWSLENTHCPWCARPASDGGHLSCWPGAPFVGDLLIALRGELEAERALADELALALQALAFDDNGRPNGDLSVLDRWEAARA